MSGSASAPYWGHLPSKTRRTSNGYSHADERSQPLDGLASTSRSQPRSDRVSPQTQAAGAPTDLTYSPLASPVNSSFKDSDLAPRPPTLPYEQLDYQPNPADKRRRRSARAHELEYFGDNPRATPPTAPDVPKAPPVSYNNRDPYGSGHNSPYTFDVSGQPGPPPSAHRLLAQARAAVADMEVEGAAPSSAARQFEKDLEARRARRATADYDGGVGGVNTARRTSTGATPSKRVSHRRRESLGPDEIQQQWANDRSPLQKLELTLDSITKDEKRARMEAAERRAREKAATTAAEAGSNSPNVRAPDRPVGQQVHFRPRRQSGGQEDQQRPIATDLRRDEPPISVRQAPTSQYSPDHRRHASLGQAPQSQIPVPKNRNVSAPVSTDLPQRNLSFRDRAARNDVDIPHGSYNASPEVPPSTMPIPAAGIIRSGSNKLRKNPPGDPWYSRRTQAEERFPTVNHRGDESQFAGGTGVSRSKTTGGNFSRTPPMQYDDYERYERPQVRGEQHGQGRYQEYDDYEDYEEPPSRSRSFAAAIGLGRSASHGAKRQVPPPAASNTRPVPQTSNGTKSVKFPEQGNKPSYDIAGSPELDEHHQFRDYFHREHTGQSLYQPPKYFDEWQKAKVGQLADALLDTQAQTPKAPETSQDDKDKAWWESSGNRKGSMSSRPHKGGASHGEHDDAQAQTQFDPALYLKCGPLLRYCGIRHESTARSRNGSVVDKEIWRGSIMIVTSDSDSSYKNNPTLRLFVQHIDLLPPPPTELTGEQALLPEYVDPIAGIPKLGRYGETLYVRPVEHLEEGKDLSMLDTDDGLFEATRTAPDFNNNAPAPPSSFASRQKRVKQDGEKLGKYSDVQGFRLHAERGCTFWRFNVEVELRDRQQRIAYRINRGPAMGFWVPARGQPMNVMFHSCNGFSLSVKPDELSGPDPMWRDVLNTHQTQPFHVMIGGGDQIYNDAVMRQTTIFKQWLEIRNPLHKHNAPFTKDLQDELETFYFERYCMWFSQGLFGLANSQIPMVNMYDDHDIIDGFGSYPDHFMRSPVFSGLGAVAFKYYMLFQHQSIVHETEENEPSWVLGCKPGPYIHELSRSLYMSLGSDLALLAVDARTERTRDEVVREDTWKKIIDRCYSEIIKGETKHLLVLLGVPIAYPRLVWLENILTSRLMDPVKAMGKAGLLGKGLLNKFDGGVEVLDDLDDHWTAKNHKEERKFVIEDLQDLAADKSVRVTILSGDVHLAAIGQFYSNPKLHLPKHKDFRYMPNVISSAIVNTPPPDMLADVLNKRNKIHHFDKETDEDMIPIFESGVDGKPRNNKRLLPHRNWCQIRRYVPGSTPPPTPPPEEDYEHTPEGTPPPRRGGLLRRLSSSSKQRGPTYRPDLPDEHDRSRPPLSGGGGGIFRSLSRRNSTSDGQQRPGKLLRTLSLGRSDSVGSKKGGFFSRRPSVSRRHPNDGGNNGDWSDEDYYDQAPTPQQIRRTRPTAFEGPNGERGDKLARMGLRGGAGNAREAAEYSAGDDSYFSVTHRVPMRSYTQPVSVAHGHSDERYSEDQPRPNRPKPVYRMSTGLSVKQLKKPARYEVDVDGALDIQINVEINPKDPAGITMPYRLLVPTLQYEYRGEDASSVADEPEYENGNAGIENAYNEEPVPKRGGTLKRLFSGRKGSQYREHRGGEGAEYDYNRDYTYEHGERYR